MKKRFWRWPLIFLSLILSGAGVVLYLNPRWVKVERIELDLVAGSGENLLFERIRKTLEPQFHQLEGKFFWAVRLSDLFELVAGDRRVKHVAIYRDFPSRLRVEIEPYTPILAYLAGDGRVYPIATDATLLPALSVGDAPDVPLVRGEELKDEPHLREAAIELYRAVPDKGPLGKGQISEIFYTRKDGFNLYLSGVASEVHMGDAEFAPKISRVQKVLSYLDAQNIKGRVIDARFSKKVVVRVRKAP